MYIVSARDKKKMRLKGKTISALFKSFFFASFKAQSSHKSHNDNPHDTNDSLQNNLALESAAQ